MRKLSKKISMLMVLAMLVSLFSGVVSASAASSWSFYNKTADEIVEVKESIEMESNQFADFDLYKDGKAFDTDVYTVKYESSNEDVVWVDPKNGKLRADKFGNAEAGDKAVISAKIENKNTGAKTTKSFTIVIAEKEVEVEYAIVSDMADEVYLTGEKYALKAVVTADGVAIEADVAFAIDGVAITEFAPVEAGDYTIVATATVDGEEITEPFTVTVKANVPEIVSAKQTALNAVEIALNDAAWVAKASKENIKVAQVIDGVDIAELVKTVEAKKDAADVLVVTLYNNMVADKTYKFEYDGFDCAASVVGAGSTPASIKVVSKKVPANTLGQAEIKVYNSAGIDVTTDALKYAAEFSTDENTVCDVQTDGSIYFFEVGKTVVVKAKFDMGWDEEGNEIKDLEAVGEYTSVEPVTYSKPNGYALNNTLALKAEKDLTYTTGTLKLSLSDEAVLVAKYEEAEFGKDPVVKYIVDGDDQHGNADAYTYKSTNESVLLVNSATGALLPCKEGYASVYIKKGDTVIGSVSIKVEGARKLNVFTASISDKKLATAITDSTEITVKAVDQFGADYGYVKYSMVLDTLQLDGVDVALADFFSISDFTDLTVADGKIALPLSASAAAKIADNKVRTIAFTVKATDTENANNEKTQRLNVSIKDNSTYTGNVTRTLNVSAGKMDTALNKKNLADYDVKIKLVKTDSETYDSGLETIAFETVATTGNNYSVVITKVGDNNFNATTSEFFKLVGNEIVVNTVKTASSKLANGTYKIQLFSKNGDKMQPSTPQYLTIEDTTPAITAVVTKTNIAALGAVADALEFYINGAKVAAENIVGVAVSDDVQIDSKQYVKKVDVTLKTKALNGDSALNLEFTKSVDVNQLFTIQ